MAGEIGWINLADAKTFFATKRLDSTAWDALIEASAKNEKTAVLHMAYDRLRFCKDFGGIPTSPTAAQFEKLQLAQLETAYYLAQHLTGEDKRKGLQAQGVTAAGVVKENYAESYLSKLPLPAIVYELMDEFKDALPFYAQEVARDEDEGVNEDVSDF